MGDGDQLYPASDGTVANRGRLALAASKPTLLQSRETGTRVH